MSDQMGPDASDSDHVLAALSELIEALDRRLPRVERLGETRIARETAALREQAATRIEQLRTRESNRQVREAELSEATMADDGGPLRRK